MFIYLLIPSILSLDERGNDDEINFYMEENLFRFIYYFILIIGVNLMFSANIK